jgi:predicted nucleic acid-binding protein
VASSPISTSQHHAIVSSQNKNNNTTNMGILDSSVIVDRHIQQLSREVKERLEGLPATTEDITFMDGMIGEVIDILKSNVLGYRDAARDLVKQHAELMELHKIFTALLNDDKNKHQSSNNKTNEELQAQIGQNNNNNNTSSLLELSTMVKGESQIQQLIREVKKILTRLATSSEDITVMDTMIDELFSALSRHIEGFLKAARDLVKQRAELMDLHATYTGSLDINKAKELPSVDKTIEELRAQMTNSKTDSAMRDVHTRRLVHPRTKMSRSREETIPSPR